MTTPLVDLMVPAYNRWAFTETCLTNLDVVTDWSLVREFVVYDSGSSDLTGQKLDPLAKSLGRNPTVVHMPPTSVTDVLVKHVMGTSSQFIAKLDNDTIVPPGWLPAMLDVLHRHPEVDLLGIEAHYPVAPAPPNGYGYKVAPFIGGIGVFRRTAFEGPMPKGRDIYFGFTEWQDKTPGLVKGWINPALAVCLLDRLPFEPWASLSMDYVRKGWQRPWPKYDPSQKILWSWKWRTS